MEQPQGEIRFDHVGIEVNSLEESVRFYEKIGFSVLGEYSERNLRIAFLQLGDSKLELLECHDGRGQAHAHGLISHIAFGVDNLDETVTRFRDLGIEAVSINPVSVLSGKGRIYFFKGPNGEKIEIYEGKNNG